MKHTIKLASIHLLMMNILCIPIFSPGQNPNHLLDIPQKFVIPSGENDLKDDGEVFNGYSWIVYSDRIYNPTYNRPGGKDLMKYLEFLVSYKVIGRQKQYLRLARESQTENKNDIQLEDFGWVEMSNLLLWNHCLVKPDNYCNKKAIVILSNETKYLFEDVKPGDDEVTQFRIFYIYKSFGDKYLIGTAPRIPKDADKAEDIIVDWVSKDFVWVWDDIEVVEPNCKFDRKIDDKKIGSSSVIFKKDGFAEKYLLKGTYSEKHLLWSNDTCRERMSATWLRFPVLDEGPQIFTVAFFPEYNGQVVKDLEKVIEGYGVWEDDPLNSMFIKVMLVSQEDLGKAIDIYNTFFEKIGTSASMAEIANTWKEILLDVRFDQRNKDLTLLTINDINRMLFSFNHSNILPGNIPLQSFADGYPLAAPDIPLYYNRLSDNLDYLRAVLNEIDYKYSFYSNGLLYYWLPTNLLP